MTSSPRLGKILPAFAQEIKSALRDSGWGSYLVDQVDALPIVGLCGCGSPECSSFYTVILPKGRFLGILSPCGGLGVERGMVIVVARDGKIEELEIINRPDVHETIVSLFPAAEDDNRLWSYNGNDVKYRASYYRE